MSRKSKPVSRACIVLLTDKETGTQWLYNSLTACAKAIGRSRVWVSQVVNNPLHIAHRDKAELSAERIYTAHGGKIRLKERGGYFRYEIQKCRPIAYKAHCIGSRNDTATFQPYTLPFATAKQLSQFLGLHLDYLRSVLAGLKEGDIANQTFYHRFMDEEFVIEKCETPKFKDGASAETVLNGVEPLLPFT